MKYSNNYWSLFQISLFLRSNLNCKTSKGTRLRHRFLILANRFWNGFAYIVLTWMDNNICNKIVSKCNVLERNRAKNPWNNLNSCGQSKTKGKVLLLVCFQRFLMIVLKHSSKILEIENNKWFRQCRHFVIIIDQNLMRIRQRTSLPDN